MATHFSTLAWRIPMDGGAWWATVHGVANSRKRLSDFIFTPQVSYMHGEIHSSRSQKTPGYFIFLFSIDLFFL